MESIFQRKRRIYIFAFVKKKHSVLAQDICHVPTHALYVGFIAKGITATAIHKTINFY